MSALYIYFIGRRSLSAQVAEQAYMSALYVMIGRRSLSAQVAVHAYLSASYVCLICLPYPYTLLDDVASRLSPRIPANDERLVPGD